MACKSCGKKAKNGVKGTKKVSNVIIPGDKKKDDPVRRIVTLSDGIYEIIRR